MKGNRLRSQRKETNGPKQKLYMQVHKATRNRNRGNSNQARVEELKPGNSATQKKQRNEETNTRTSALETVSKQ